MYPMCMIACATTHAALVALLLVLTAFAGTQRSAPARKKKQAKDELAPIVAAFDIGLSFTRGVVGVGAGVASATRGLANLPNLPNGPVPVPYAPRQLKADSGSQTTFCAEGIPDSVRARISKFTSIVRATAKVTNMLVDEMCGSGEIQRTLDAIKKALSGVSCSGAIDAMRKSVSMASTASTASTGSDAALLELVEAIADATCSPTKHTIDGEKLGKILDGVGAAFCSPVDQADPSCAGILVKTKPTDSAYTAQLVRALARAVRANAAAGARPKCNMMITSVRGMDKEFDAIAAVVRSKEITRGCAMITSALDARAEMGDTASIVSVVRASLVSALCAHSDALASMSSTDLKELVVATIQAMCST